MALPQVQVYEARDELFAAAANTLRDVARKAVESRDRFLWVLSGGNTPKPLYRLLSQPPYDTQIPWQETHVFWGDERAVEPDDPESNYGQAYELLLRKVDLPDDQIHRIRGERAAAEAARLYARTLVEFAARGKRWPRFDLVLLGMGTDGHTASLFPGSTHPLRQTQPTLAVTGNYGDRPSGRVTLTPPVFNSAHHIHFLVLGAEKAKMLARVLSGEQNPLKHPAQRIRPENGQVIWFVDREAAVELDTPTRP